MQRNWVHIPDYVLEGQPTYHWEDRDTGEVVAEVYYIGNGKRALFFRTKKLISENGLLVRGDPKETDFYAIVKSLNDQFGQSFYSAQKTKYDLVAEVRTLLFRIGQLTSSIPDAPVSPVESLKSLSTAKFV
jgi:hypothetical protein